MDLQPHDQGDLPINYEVMDGYSWNIFGIWYMWNKDSTHAAHSSQCPHKVELRGF